jgi:hypothetical protein
MSSQPPILDGKPLSEEQIRLNVLFDEMKKNQLTFLDEAGKRVVELSTGLLGVLFAVTAFGKDFPPPYLKANPNSQWLAIAVLAIFILALLFGVLTVQPRNYGYYEYNLTRMRKELDKIVVYKSFCMQVATWAFFGGTLLLAVLIGTLVLGA